MVKAGIMAPASGAQQKSSHVTGAGMADDPALSGAWIGSVRYHRPCFEWDGRPTVLPIRVRYSGEKLVILLHGIGCSSESFDDAFEAASLQSYSICAFDFPGHGRAAGLLSARHLDEPADLLRSYADITHQVVRWIRKDEPRISQVFLAGHSMGGAVGVIAASEDGDISGLINIDGNLVAEDCGIVSRRMAKQSLDEFLKAGYSEFVAELGKSSGEDFKAWARWCAKANPTAVHQAAQSLVSWSDSGELLEMFNKIPARAYLYGDADDRQYIVKRIAGPRVKIESVQGSGHFAMIDNVTGFYGTLAAVLAGMRREVSF